jgi:hypothetical protein
MRGCPVGARQAPDFAASARFGRQPREASVLGVMAGARVQAPGLPQHFLDFLPLPQTQGSLRPTFGCSRT